MKPNIRRRLEFIEFCLSWEGSIGRKRLQDQLSISLQQATKDLTLYLDLHPENIRYDHRRKAYVPSEKYRPALTSGKSEEYFVQLDMLFRKHKKRDDIWIGQMPEFDCVATVSRSVSPQTLKAVLQAIKANHGVQFGYSSVSSGRASSRIAYPHAIASDGHRWHMRAYDEAKDRFSDFLLPRMTSVCAHEFPQVRKHTDIEWETYVVVQFQPDPVLNEENRRQLSLEYAMDSGVLELSVRKSMLFYTLRNYGFNPWPGKDMKMENKSSYWLHIKNYDEVEEWIGRRG